MSYNGWTNRETWLCNLWIGDALYDLESVTPETVEALVYSMAEVGLEGLMSDLLNSAISQINFYEIAEAANEDR